MFIEKPRFSADKRKSAISELLPAIIRKLFYEHVFAGHDGTKVEPDSFGADAPFARVCCQVHHFRCVEERLGRHATAKDAEAANFFAAFDHGRTQSGGGCRPSGGVTTTAPANNRDVVLETITHSVSQWSRVGWHSIGLRFVLCGKIVAL